jgi:hypothetical protein
VQTLLARPLDAARFSLALLGSPLGSPLQSTALAVCAGLVVVAVAVAAAMRWRRERSPTALALIAFLGYEVASALGVAGGRLVFGKEYALEGRYTTPALFAWAAALLLALSLLRGFRGLPRAFAAVATAATVALFAAQLGALDPAARQTRFVRMTGGLALELDARDLTYSRALYPTEEVFEFAQWARERGWAGFGDPPLAGLRGSLGRSADELGLHACEATIDDRARLDSHPLDLRISGAVRDAASFRAPDRVYFVSGSMRVVGAGIVAAPRVDWHAWLRRPPQAWPYRGYVIDDGSGTPSAYCP